MCLPAEKLSAATRARPHFPPEEQLWNLMRTKAILDRWAIGGRQASKNVDRWALNHDWKVFRVLGERMAQCAFAYTIHMYEINYFVSLRRLWIHLDILCSAFSPQSSSFVYRISTRWNGCYDFDSVAAIANHRRRFAFTCTIIYLLSIFSKLVILFHFSALRFRFSSFVFVGVRKRHEFVSLDSAEWSQRKTDRSESRNSGKGLGRAQRAGGRGARDPKLQHKRIDLLVLTARVHYSKRERETTQRKRTNELGNAFCR